MMANTRPLFLLPQRPHCMLRRGDKASVLLALSADSAVCSVSTKIKRPKSWVSFIGRGKRSFFTPQRQNRVWGTPSAECSFPGDKAAGTWSWPLTFIQYRGKDCCSYIFTPLYVFTGVYGSVVGWGTMQQAERSRVRVPMRRIFSIYLILRTALWSLDRLSF
jgi:hypothetical protein